MAAHLCPIKGGTHLRCIVEKKQKRERWDIVPLELGHSHNSYHKSQTDLTIYYKVLIVVILEIEVEH